MPLQRYSLPASLFCPDFVLFSVGLTVETGLAALPSVFREPVGPLVPVVPRFGAGPASGGCSGPPLDRCLGSETLSFGALV